MQITFKEVDFYYKNSCYILSGVNLCFKSQKVTAIVGRTGSGKSTLLQHLNVLLKPKSGVLEIGSFLVDSAKKSKSLKSIRKKVGVVCQFPEQQLFEETVEKDICFGAVNYGMSRELASSKSLEILKAVGLNESFLAKSPFELSGGQMRLVAIAGILIMEPEVLVLDEPTVGLDPQTRVEILQTLMQYKREKKITIILVTHNMDEVFKFADEVVILDGGAIASHADVETVFRNKETLKKYGLTTPNILKLQELLEKKCGCRLERLYFDEQQLALSIARGELC